MGLGRTSNGPVVRETRATMLYRLALEKRRRKIKDAEKTEHVKEVRADVDRGRAAKKRRRRIDVPAPKPLRRACAQSKKTSERATNGKARKFKLPDDPIPSFANNGAGPMVDIDEVGGVMHGVEIQFLDQILETGEVLSTFARTGEVIPSETDKAASKRKKDQIRGGSTAVFTRAFGRRQFKFKAAGYGVGSSHVPEPGEWAGGVRAQLIMSGVVLQREGVRAGTIDYHGGIHGASDAYLNGTRGDFKKVYGAWGMQTRPGYNRVIKESVTGDVKDHNEQLHYLKMPLDGVLRGILCTSQEAFDETIRTCGGTVNTDPNAPYAGTIRKRGVDIPVVLADGEDSMVLQLQKAEIADADGRVR